MINIRNNSSLKERDDGRYNCMPYLEVYWSEDWANSSSQLRP